MPTREQAKKAWEHGRQSLKHYQGLTEEQKTAMWLYARDNGLISKENLSNAATPEYEKYVKTDWATTYAPKATNDPQALKADKYANYQGVKVPIKENKTVTPTLTPKITPKLTLAQSQQQKLKRQQISEIMTADKQPLKPTLNKPVSKYDAERKALSTPSILPDMATAKKLYDKVNKEGGFDKLNDEGKRVYLQYRRDQGLLPSNDLNEQGKALVNKYVSEWATYAPRPSNKPEDLKADKYANYKGIKVPLKEDKVTTPSQQTGSILANNSGSILAKSKYDAERQAISKTGTGGLFNQPAQEVKPSSGGLFNQTPQKTNPSSGGLFKAVEKPKETVKATTKNENLKDKALNFFANIGKKAMDTYETTANKDRIGLLGSDKVFSIKDAQNYTNGPKGENPIFNAMAKPSRTALYTLLAPMRSKLFNRGISQATNTLVMDENASKKIDTGSKVGNAIADMGGTILGYATNPAGVNGSLLNLSQGLSKPVEKAIAKKIVPKITNAALKKAPNILAYKAAETGAKLLPAMSREFTEGAGLSVLSDVMNNKKPKEILKNAAIEGTAGAILGGGIEGLGMTKDFLKNNAVKTTITESKLGLKSPLDKKFLTKSNIENAKLKDYYNNIDYQDYINSLDPKYLEAENAFRKSKGLQPLKDIETTVTPTKEIKPMLNKNMLSKKIEPVLKPVENNKNLNFPMAKELNPKFKPLSKTLNEVAATAEMPKVTSTNTTTIPNTLNTITSKLDKTTNKHTAARAYTEIIDNLDPINRVSPNAYEKAMNTRQNDMIAHRILTNKLVDTNGNVIGDSLKDITKDIPIAQKTEFADYLKARHAPSWIDQGRKVYPDNLGMTSEMARQKALNYEAKYPQFKAQADKLVKFQQDLTKSWLVDTGIMKQSSWDELIKKYPDYVPFMREFNPLEKGGGVYAKRGFVNLSNPVKQGIGSQRNTIDSVETIAERISQYVKTAKRNEVGKELVKTIQGNPTSFSGIAEIVTPKNAELNSNALADINKILETEGIDGIVTKLNNSFDDMFSARKGGAIEKGNNIVTVLDNGSPVYLKINDPDLLQAVSSLDQSTIPKIFQAIGKGTNVMKTLTTGINPAFGLARNVWKDLVTGYVNTKTINANPLGYAKYIWDLTRAVGNVLGEGTDKAIGSKLPDSLEALLKKSGDAMASFQNIGGGGHASNITADRNVFNDSIKSLYKQKPSLKNIPKTLYKGLEGLNNTMEVAPRLAEYKRQIKAGNSIDKALFESQDLTTNFSRHGNTAKLIDSFVPYYNAAWQGLDKTIRQFNPANGNGKQVLNSAAKAIYAITIPTIVLYAKNHNDPNYQMLSDYQKDNFFNIPKGDGTFIKIPKPRELGVVFGAYPERLLRTYKDNDPEGFKRFAENAWQNFAPPDPLTENITMPAFKTLNTPEGRDWRNKPIVSQGQLTLSPKLQYDESTSEFGKTVGNVVNVSPKKIDNLAKSYLGGVAQFGLPALTKGKDMASVMKSQFIVDPLYSNDILNDFYKRYDKAKTAAADNNKINSIPSKLLTKQERIVSQYKKTSDTISRLQDMIKLEKDQDKIKELRKLILQKAKEANY